MSSVDQADDDQVCYLPASRSNQSTDKVIDRAYQRPQMPPLTRLNRREQRRSLCKGFRTLRKG
jgi:hypothetical protein